MRMSGARICSSLLKPSADSVVVLVLRASWSALVLWYEFGIFAYSLADCRWPVSNSTHVLIVADPQVLDHRSYPGRSWYLTALTQFIVDLNLRKSWRAVRRLRPHAVVFLGDMMDGGRFAMQDSEYESYYQRFKSIFSLHSSIPVYHLPGNHDVGLGKSSYFSADARSRYTAHFGPLNYQLSLNNHTMVFIDAPSLVEEDYQRTGHRPAYAFADWKPIRGGPTEFLKTFASEEHKDPVILFSHIPLWRSDSAKCGPLREKGTIHAGVGTGYQNTIGKEASSFLLQSVKPAVIFSGDDHDYCSYIHRNQGNDVREVTVRSFSMAMGVRRPGFQLLSLVSPSLENTHPYPDTPCHLPDQMWIYLSVYTPLIVLSLVALLISNFFRVREQPYSLTSPREPSTRSRRHSDSIWTSASPVSTRFARSRFEGKDGHESSSEDEALDPTIATSSLLPGPPLSPRGSYSVRSVVFGVRPFIDALAQRTWNSKRRRMRRSLLRGFMMDLMNVALFPIALWIFIAWRMFTS